VVAAAAIWRWPRPLVTLTGSMPGDLPQRSGAFVRVLGNMIKNALEASGKGETVTVGLSPGRPHVEFLVHNPRRCPGRAIAGVPAIVFDQRRGRGLGTYSIKLLMSAICMDGLVCHFAGGGTVFGRAIRSTSDRRPCRSGNFRGKLVYGAGSTPRSPSGVGEESPLAS